MCPTLSHRGHPESYREAPGEAGRHGHRLLPLHLPGLPANRREVWEQDKGLVIWYYRAESLVPIWVSHWPSTRGTDAPATG